jgi:hypothetical protein
MLFGETPLFIVRTVRNTQIHSVGSQYLTGNTLILRYRTQPINAVWENSRCLLWNPYGTHRYTVWAECSPYLTGNTSPPHYTAQHKLQDGLRRITGCNLRWWFTANIKEREFIYTVKKTVTSKIICKLISTLTDLTMVKTVHCDYVRQCLNTFLFAVSIRNITTTVSRHLQI